MKNRVTGVVKRPFNWAIEQGLITHSPIAQLKAPPKRNREIIITPDLWAQITQIVKDRPFQEMLAILRETGCRPLEARTVEAQHVRDGSWMFSKMDSKGQRYNRVVLLNEFAEETTRRLMVEHPEGPIFRNRSGRPWTKDSLGCRFKRLSKKLGTRIVASAFRHTFCTEGLERGVDSTTMAILMGHRDPTMVAKVYSHLTGNKIYLHKSLRQARGSGDAA